MEDNQKEIDGMAAVIRPAQEAGSGVITISKTTPFDLDEGTIIEGTLTSSPAGWENRA